MVEALVGRDRSRSSGGPQPICCRSASAIIGRVAVREAVGQDEIDHLVLRARDPDRPPGRAGRQRAKPPAPSAPRRRRRARRCRSTHQCLPDPHAALPPLLIVEDRPMSRRSLICNILQKPRNPVNRALTKAQNAPILSRTFSTHTNMTPPDPNATDEHFVHFCGCNLSRFVCSNFHNEAWITVAKPREPIGRRHQMTTNSTPRRTRR